MNFLTYLWRHELKGHLIALTILSSAIAGLLLFNDRFPDVMRLFSALCFGVFIIIALVSPIFMFRDWLRNQRERYEIYKMEMRWREQQQAIKDGDE